MPSTAPFEVPDPAIPPNWQLVGQRPNERLTPMKNLLALALIGTSMTISAAPSLEVGESFPILSLPHCGNEGQSSSIEAFRGRKLMLHLFASW